MARAVGRPRQAWRTRAWVVGAGFSVLAALIGAHPLSWNWQESFDLEVFFRLRGARPAPSEVVLVPIDGRAQESLFLPEASREFERCADVRAEPRPGYRNPDPPDVLTRWPRCLHAMALEALAAAEPELVVMDISFRPRSDPGEVYAEQDQRLAAAMRKLGKVMLIRKIRPDASAGGVAQPIAAEIESAALATAPFLLLGERLSRAAKFCTFIEDGALVWPCLPTAALHLPKLALNALGSARLTELYDGSGTRYFNFYGPPGSFQTLRYESLVAGAEPKRLEPGSLRGKIVFFGFAEQRTPEAVEHFATPFTTASSVKLSGVELAATAYANLRDGSAIMPAPRWLRVLVTLALGLACTAVLVAYPLKRALPLALGCALLYLGGALVAFDRYAAWFPLLVPLGVALPSTLGAGVLARVLEMKRVHEHLREVIANLLPPSQAIPVVEKGASLTDLQLSAPGLSINSDIARYTAYTETHSAEEVAQLIGPYFAELRRIAVDYGVYAIDFAGDSMMCSWPDLRADRGANSGADAALRERLCRAALEIARAAAKLRLPGSKQALCARLGMAYGLVKFAQTGNAIRAVGATPNTAQRLQTFNEALGTRIIVSRAVIRGLSGIVVRYLGDFRLPKMKKATRVYELACLQTEATPALLARHEAFRKALAAYRADRRAEAQSLFDELAAARDGPSIYYAALCRRQRYLGHKAIPVKT